ncbi:ATP-binding cassette domain-containing protein [[Clostridium] polysaccharolyticum]|uniref:ABC-2 type transport system ATP-binding protein n=1 Tax=[Clostridium] polysaccharolyticum TaxID=29364 RepID=A0A1H9YW18_9FIRM|nr:ATP-binding cassette domain-containing protein [[Clostridium] polysaccharolyticum]SES73312.1 ABC-2 type transport system ATP-binding protein [[Clostridium] polysaccharolyticum]
MEYVLASEYLTKRFRKHIAVNNVNLHVKRGDIYGFIGKNGAGKTTFLKMAAGLSHPTSGEIVLFGKRGNEITKNNLVSKIGTLIENPGLYGNLTAYQNLKMKCIGVGKNDPRYINELLELVGLEHTEKKKTKQFSLGMRQRLGIALALVGEPELLLLDEPVNGLDPQGIAEIRNTILRLNREKNITIIISSHILEELSKIATSYGIIDNGQLIKELTKEELEFNCGSWLEIRTSNAAAAADILNGMGVTQINQVDDNTLYVLERMNESAYFNENLVKNGIQVELLNVTNRSIEEYYLQLTGGIANA